MAGSKKKKVQKTTGTREWSSSNVNIVQGCSHDCWYCYAKAMAIEFARKTPETWSHEDVDLVKVEKGYGKRRGTIMFPTTHDITPAILEPCMTVLGKMLKAGNSVLVVSKPHFECVKALCAEFGEYRDQILFRFTIGSASDEVLVFWEPGAPGFGERLASLEHAFRAGFRTSVSCEPMLDGNIHAVVEEVLPLVTDSVWLGKMNKVNERLSLNKAPDRVRAAAQDLIALQSDDRILALYERYGKNPKIKWKGSIKPIVGIPAPREKGMDI